MLGQPAVLPLLQFTLRALWEKRDRNRITWEVYRKVGDPLNALRVLWSRSTRNALSSGSASDS